MGQTKIHRGEGYGFTGILQGRPALRLGARRGRSPRLAIAMAVRLIENSSRPQLSRLRVVFQCPLNTIPKPGRVFESQLFLFRRIPAAGMDAGRLVR